MEKMRLSPDRYFRHTIILQRIAFDIRIFIRILAPHTDFFLCGFLQIFQCVRNGYLQISSGNTVVSLIVPTTV